MPLQEPPAVVAFDERADLVPGLFEALEVMEVQALLGPAFPVPENVARAKSRRRQISHSDISGRPDRAFQAISDRTDDTENLFSTTPFGAPPLYGPGTDYRARALSSSFRRG